MLASIDAMSALQTDILRRGRAVGGLCTFVAYAVMLFIFTIEVWAFFMPADYRTTISLDENSDQLIQLNIDITMHKIECKNLRLLVKDSFGREPLNTLTNDFSYRPVQLDGRQAGNAYRELTNDALAAKSEKLSRGASKEMDSDWDSSHDGFQHKSFKQVVNNHDFIFVNFFASWCPHCRNFAPTWATIASTLNQKKFTDADGTQHDVLFIKMNCVDFAAVCDEQQVDAYPTLRLYPRKAASEEFDGARDLKSIDTFVSNVVRSAHFANEAGTKHACNIRGRLLVPRVPGMFAMESGGLTADQGLNPMRANVSHTIAHMSFSDPGDGIFHKRTWRGLPSWVLDHLNPMDGKEFVTTSAETAPHHYVKVVSTRTPAKSKIYQFAHTSRDAWIRSGEVPEMRIFYDLEPMMVEVSLFQKPWYDFLCGLLALVGGVYVAIEGFVGVSRLATNRIAYAAVSRQNSALTISDTDD